MKLKLPIQFGGKLPESSQGKVEWLEELYKLSDSVRRAAEPEMYTNVLFLAGNQWEAAAEDVRRFGRVPVPSPSLKQKIVANRILPLYRQTQSAMVDNLARQVAVAATTDPDDVAAAEIATDFLESRLHEDDERTRRLEDIGWAMCCGRALRMTDWDPDADGQSILGRVEGFGDIRTVTLNPWRYHLCPWVDCYAEQPFIIVSDVKGVDDINDMFPGHDVQPEEYSDVTRMLDKLVVNIVAGREGTAPKRKGAAIIKRMLCRPSKAFPRGRLFVWANNKLLLEADLAEGEMPFVAIDWFPIVGRAYPLPFITPLRPLQQEINITLSQLTELRNRQLRGDMVVRGGPNATITQEWAREQVGVDEYGAPIMRNTGQKVIRLSPGIDEWKFLDYDLRTSEAEKLLAEMWNVMMSTAGVHQSTLGAQLPAGTPATTALMMKDSDLTGLTFFRAGADMAYSKVDRHKLHLASNHYELPRMVRIVGQKGVSKSEAFFGADLRNTEDVRPRPVPVVSETMKAQMKRENAQLWDLSGPAQVKLAKVTALLNSGIPGIEEEVDSLLAPYTVDDLRAICAEINALEVQSSYLQAQGQLDQITMGLAALEGQAQGIASGGDGLGAPEQPLPEGAAVDVGTVSGMPAQVAQVLEGMKAQSSQPVG